MNGDILSDLTSALVGGLGFAPSANLGSDVAIFEPVHGSAPKYAGKNTINPTAEIGTAVMMLRHLGHFEQASAIENALLATLEQGIATRDIKGDDGGAASTTEFTEAIIGNLGSRASSWTEREYRPIQMPEVTTDPVLVRPASRRVVGADIFVEWGGDAVSLGERVTELVADTPLELRMVDNRGTVVYPPTGTLTDVVDAWRCRLMARDGELRDVDLLTILGEFDEIPFTHVEKLHEFDGEPAFSKAQGED
jgi:isocitrate dehydrogenase